MFGGGGKGPPRAQSQAQEAPTPGQSAGCSCDGSAPDVGLSSGFPGSLEGGRSGPGGSPGADIGSDTKLLKENQAGSPRCGCPTSWGCRSVRGLQAVTRLVCKSDPGWVPRASQCAQICPGFSTPDYPLGPGGPASGPLGWLLFFPRPLVTRSFLLLWFCQSLPWILPICCAPRASASCMPSGGPASPSGPPPWCSDLSCPTSLCGVCMPYMLHIGNRPTQSGS